jgi:hypothetical protein
VLHDRPKISTRMRQSRTDAELGMRLLDDAKAHSSPAAQILIDVAAEVLLGASVAARQEATAAAQSRDATGAGSTAGQAGQPQ